MAAPTLESLDLDELFKLRLAVARFGEMDLARWWNTRGQLGKLGAAALRRGFPRTHRLAQARTVFAVAAHRCDEVFNPPQSVTLWRLPDIVEEAFEARWEHWIAQAGPGALSGIFEAIESLSYAPFAGILTTLGLVNEEHINALGRLRRSAEGRAVPLPGVFSGAAHDLGLLALAFGRGEEGALAVPYQRWSSE